MTTFHPAPWVLAEYSRQCPDVFKNADTFRKTDPDSPWWFMTSRQCQAWLKDYLRTHPVPVTGQLSREALKTYTPLGEFIVLAAWRTGKTIIRCDEALLEALDKTGLHDALPAGALLRLPFWGFYLEFPSYRVAMPHPDVRRIPAHGAFITLTDAADGRGTNLLALVVGAGATSQEGMHPTMATFLPVAGTTGEALSALRSELARHFWRAVLPVLFYLCAENTDWGDTGIPLRPTPKKVRRRGERFFEPPQTQVLNVGVRVGAALRQLHQHFREQTADAQNSGPSGGRCLRPHIRRAHWQGYRTGQKNQDTPQKREMRWIAPVFVNARDNDMLQAVIRSLK
ncbi:hypothetical protein EL06_20965 [Salmonella enterica subsp. diarizonae]|uniref:Uncharacterized protein n=1 Tax=Salmonella diarizonae TaxID=59204 RepID=A0A6C8Y0U8_SALDZ|nr:hypothetical protein [Salmonella enterica subsp. diarizonae]